MKEEQRLIEFVHIEKTAGTVVRSAIESNVSLDDLYIYSPQADRLAASSSNLQPQTSEMLERLREGIANPLIGPLLLRMYPFVNNITKSRMLRLYPQLEIPDNAKVIFGHFTANQFDDLLDGEPIRAIMIRDPLERMRSHYDHWSRNYGYADWRVNIPFDRSLTFELFAMLPQLQDYQTQALSGLDIGSFEFVGVTEDTDEFIRRFLEGLREKDFTISEQLVFPTRRLNTTPINRKTPLADLNEEFVRRFSEFHAQDYYLYAQAKIISASKTVDTDEE